MRGLAGGAGVSILAAVLAVLSFRQVGDRPPDPGKKATAVAVEPAGGAERDAGDGDAAPVDRPDPCDGGEHLLDEFRELYGFDQRFRHLIVLAPDPFESNGPELFDFVLEGVEEAVSQGKADLERASTEEAARELDETAYVHDTQWLPWTDSAAMTSRCWEKQPGVIVYRPLDGTKESEPLMVLVVGETPIKGLRPGQFHAAIDLIERYGVPAGTEKAPFLVLGPTYSGTAASLSAVIASWIPHRHVAIVSGTAATVKAREILVPGSPAPPCPGPTSPVATGPSDAPVARSGLISYESATATDACLLERLETFLLARGGTCHGGGGRGGGRGNMILFTETSTTYGSVGSSGSEEPGASCFRRWKLPPDLASIRTSSAAVDDEEKGAAGQVKAPLEPAESVEGTNRRLSPTSVALRKLALGSTLEWMSDSKIRFAGIIATDPRDVIFLARRFREQLPDVRLFTLGASIQYTDGRAADALNGMLVVHSTPGDGNRSISLQNQFVRRIYYACRTLFGGDRLEPEVKISFIGNGRLWEIDDQEGGRSPPPSWQFTFACFIVLFIAAVVVVACGSLKDGWRRRGRFWTQLAPCAEDDLKRHDRAISAALVLVCAGPPLLMLESMISRHAQQPDQWGICFGTSVLAVIPTWLFLLDGYRSKKASSSDHWLLSFLPIAASSVVLALALYLGCGPERRATFHLLSGGSPVLVGLIALSSFALALCCARARLRLLDSHRFRARARSRFQQMVPPIAQALNEKRGGGTGLADVERRLLDALYHPWKQGRWVTIAVFGVLLLTLAVPIYMKPPHTLEPGWRNAALIGLGVVATLPTSVNLAWFLTTWLGFMRLLRRLANFPAIAALERLEGRHPRPLEEQLAWSSSGSTQLVHAVKALGRLAEVDRRFRESHEQCRQLLDRNLSAEATGQEPADVELVRLLLATSATATADRRNQRAKGRERIDELAASLIDVFIPRYVRHFRLFIPPMVFGCLCSIFIASLYFVQPQRLISTIALFSVAVTVAVAFLWYLALYLDPVISAVAGSKSGKLTSRLALARNFLLWSAIPVAGYLAVEHPEFPLWVSNLLDFVGKSLR